MITSRREFLGQLGSLALLGLRTEPPESVLYNGHIITIDPELPRAQALAIAGDRILAVGSNSEIRPLARRGTRLVDLGGKTVVPGFIDRRGPLPLTSTSTARRCASTGPSD